MLSKKRKKGGPVRPAQPPRPPGRGRRGLLKPKRRGQALATTVARSDSAFNGALHRGLGPGAFSGWAPGPASIVPVGLGTRAHSVAGGAGPRRGHTRRVHGTVTRTTSALLGLGAALARGHGRALALRAAAPGAEVEGGDYVGGNGPQTRLGSKPAVQGNSTTRLNEKSLS
jgi:hypothetical protein